MLFRLYTDPVAINHIAHIGIPCHKITKTNFHFPGNNLKRFFNNFIGSFIRKQHKLIIMLIKVSVSVLNIDVMVRPMMFSTLCKPFSEK